MTAAMPASMPGRRRSAWSLRKACSSGKPSVTIAPSTATGRELTISGFVGGWALSCSTIAGQAASSSASAASGAGPGPAGAVPGATAAAAGGAVAALAARAVSVCGAGPGDVGSWRKRRGVSRSTWGEAPKGPPVRRPRSPTLSLPAAWARPKASPGDERAPVPQVRNPRTSRARAGSEARRSWHGSGRSPQVADPRPQAPQGRVEQRLGPHDRS